MTILLSSFFKAMMPGIMQASSSNWQSTGLQIRVLGVRVPPGLPNHFFKDQRQTARNGSESQAAFSLIFCF
jgi:hypothetical protein